MSSEIAIQVRGLSKRYEIYETPRDRLKQFFLPRLRNLFGMKDAQYFQEFWPLRDINFELKKGETLGIIGRNGSGKSTLLQILCGTLTPTNGEVEVTGRVAALLELGSGFNPEFTGRENVYMNAAVLGLSEEQINARFSDIVSFADIGDFIEQPVKTYSSGMMLRLAFAVIVHVDADILVIDEALAVGDAVFTQKCMRFLRNFMETGTLLFVSHDTSSVINLCERGLWLNKGQAKMIGAAEDTANSYMEYCLQETYGDTLTLESKTGNSQEEKSQKSMDHEAEQDTKFHFFEDIANASGFSSGLAEIKKVSLRKADGEELSTYCGGEEVVLQIDVDVHQELNSPIIGWILKDRLGQSLFGENTFIYAPKQYAPRGSTLTATFGFRLPMLPDGGYSMMVSVADGDLEVHTQHHWLHDAVLLQVSSKKVRYGLVGITFSDVNLCVRSYP